MNLFGDQEKRVPRIFEEGRENDIEKELHYLQVMKSFSRAVRKSGCPAAKKEKIFR